MEIYIDGSAFTNPGSLVGCAGIIKYPDYLNLPNKKLWWSYKIGAIGCMELLALVNAIKWINKNTEDLLENKIASVSIFSDSQYVVNGATSWINYWSNPWNKDKWKKKDGGTVKYEKIWREYLREKNKCRFQINIEWVEGKSTQETKDVDKFAKKAAKSLIKKPNFEYIPFKQGRSLLGKSSKLELFNDVGRTHLIFVNSHGMVSRKKGSECEVRFEIIGNEYIKGRYRAFTSQEVNSKCIDRGGYYYATFNDNTDLPWIIEIKNVSETELASIKERVKLILSVMK